MYDQVSPCLSSYLLITFTLRANLVFVASVLVVHVVRL